MVDSLIGLPKIGHYFVVDKMAILLCMLKVFFNKCVNKF